MNRKIVYLCIGVLILISMTSIEAGEQEIKKEIVEQTQVIRGDELTILIRPGPGLIFSRGIETVFTNNGPDTITDISYSHISSAESGFILFNAECDGEIEEILPGEEVIIHCRPFGVGKIHTQVEAIYGKNSLRSEASSFLFLLFIFNMESLDEVLTLDITGLTSLGENAAYEGWIIVDGSPISTGIFGVNEEGELMKTKFNINKNDLAAATTFVLTVEPFPDPDPMPSATHILAGDFMGEIADLTIGHPAALGDDFTTSTGEYILATPSTTTMDDELSGVWLLNPNMGDPIPGLDIPELPAGWKYEGWAVIEGIPVTTGKFLDPAMADESNYYSGSEPTPPFPGEDFIENAPQGLTFPTSLEDDLIVLSVEPEPDNSDMPFLLKPLVALVPNPAMDHIVYAMDNNAEETNPTGVAIRGPMGKIVVANRGSGTISVINEFTDEVIGTYDLPGDTDPEPMYVVYDSNSERVFVNDRANNEVVVFDPHDFSVETTVPTGEGSFHMWADSEGTQLWINNDIDNTATVIDPGTLTVTTTVDMPADLVDMGGKPHDVIIDPSGDYAYVSLLGFPGVNDYVVKFSTDTFDEVDRVAVGKDPHFMVTEEDNNLYVACQENDSVFVLDRSTLDLVDEIPVPGAHGVYITNDGDYLYVTNLPGAGIDALFTIDLDSLSVIGDPVNAPHTVPHNIVLTENNHKLYMTHSGPNDKVSVYSISDEDPIPVYTDKITVEDNPFGLTYVP